MNNAISQGQLQHPIRTAVILVVLAYVVIYLSPLDVRPLASPDEIRYGQIPREMIQTGDWVVPHLTGLRYFEKPPLGYWLNAVSMKIFGETHFGIRLPSALSAGLSAWFIWLLLIRLGYDRRLALASASVYLGFTIVVIVASLAILDTPFTLFLTGGMVLFYLSANNESLQQQRRYLIGSGILFGLAFLTKGFLAIVLPGIILFTYALLQRRYALLWKSTLAASIAILTILPWAIAIHLREPDFWHYFVYEEHIRRFLAANAQHPAPFYFFITELPITAFPWVGFLPAVIAGLRLNGVKSDFIKYLLLWFVLPFIFFSISKGKLSTYVLPCFAPAAILTAIGIVNYLKSGRRRLFTLGIVLNTVFLLLINGVLLYEEYIDTADTKFMAHESTKLFVISLSILLASAMTFSALFLQNIYHRIALIVCTIAPVFLAVPLAMPDTAIAGRSPIAYFDEVGKTMQQDTILISDANVVRAVAWTFKRTDILLMQEGELEYGLSYPEHKHRLLGFDGLRKLMQQWAAGDIKQDIAFFCEEPCLPSMTDILKPYAVRHSNTEFAVWLIQAKH